VDTIIPKLKLWFQYCHCCSYHADHHLRDFSSKNIWWMIKQSQVNESNFVLEFYRGIYEENFMLKKSDSGVSISILYGSPAIVSLNNKKNAISI